MYTYTYTHYTPNSSILPIPYVGYDGVQKEGWRGLCGGVERQGREAYVEAAE